MDRAQGRTSAYVVSAMGAISPARWQTTHESYRIGATSRVNVISPDAPLCAPATAGISASATMPAAKTAPEEADRRRAALPSLSWSRPLPTVPVSVHGLANYRDAALRTKPTVRRQRAAVEADRRSPSIMPHPTTLPRGVQRHRAGVGRRPWGTRADRGSPRVRRREAPARSRCSAASRVPCILALTSGPQVPAGRPASRTGAGSLRSQ